LHFCLSLENKIGETRAIIGVYGKKYPKVVDWSIGLQEIRKMTAEPNNGLAGFKDQTTA
jgi:hypothetical protein